MEHATHPHNASGWYHGEEGARSIGNVYLVMTLRTGYMLSNEMHPSDPRKYEEEIDRVRHMLASERLVRESFRPVKCSGTAIVALNKFVDSTETFDFNALQWTGDRRYQGYVLFDFKDKENWFFQFDMLRNAVESKGTYGALGLSADPPTLVETELPSQMMEDLLHKIYSGQTLKLSAHTTDNASQDPLDREFLDTLEGSIDNASLQVRFRTVKDGTLEVLTISASSITQTVVVYVGNAEIFRKNIGSKNIGMAVYEELVDILKRPGVTFQKWLPGTFYMELFSQVYPNGPPMPLGA